MTKKCTNCESDFTCTADTHCWCLHYPAIKWASPKANCYCSDCLLEAMAKEINDYTPSIDEITKQAIAALGVPQTTQEGIDYIINKKGLFVWTRWYLLRRGKCCSNGCKNCPYQDEHIVRL